MKKEVERLKMETKHRVKEHVDMIGQLFPNTLTEVIKGYNAVGDPIIEKVIDFDILRQELSEVLVEGPTERYQMNWPDKRKSILLANTPTNMTLRPCREESVDFDNTENLYIEGNNLEVLKLLQETYLNKVKMIYIDPPYNTGNDSFVYDDNFRMDSQTFSEMSGKYDEEGNVTFDIKENNESNGRFHTDWLNMMYPRLKIARDLLKEDGVIFISIDDKEVSNVQKICNEIFGEENQVATFPWRKRTAKSDVPFGISQDYEWIVCFAKTNQFIACIEGVERKYYTSPDLPNRPWRIHDMTTQRTALERPNSNFSIVNPKTKEEYPVNPNAVWRVTKETIKDYEKEKRIVYPGDYDFLAISKPVLRYFKEDDAKKAGEMFGYMSVSTKFPEEVGLTQDGTKDFSKLFSDKIFGYPKPISLIKHLAKITTCIDKDSIILDFFSGSGTTAQAI